MALLWRGCYYASTTQDVFLSDSEILDLWYKMRINSTFKTSRNLFYIDGFVQKWMYT